MDNQKYQEWLERSGKENTKERRQLFKQKMSENNIRSDSESTPTAPPEPTSGWRERMGSTLEWATDAINIGRSFMGWMAKGVGGIGEFGTNVIGWSADKVWLDKLADASYATSDFIEEWTENYRNFVEPNEQNLTNTIAGLAGQATVSAKTIQWVSKLGWWLKASMNQKLTELSPKLAKYLAATPAAKATRWPMKSTIMSLPKVAASITTEGTIDAAIENGDVQGSDFVYEAIAQGMFWWWGKALSPVAKKIQDIVPTKKLKDMYTQAADKAFKQIEGLRVKSSKVDSIMKVFEVDDITSFDKIGIVLKDQFDDLAKTKNTQEAADNLKLPNFYSNILKTQEQIGENLGSSYKQIFKQFEESGNQEAIDQFSLSAGNLVSKYIKKDNILPGQLRPNSSYWKNIKQHLKSLYPDINDDVLNQVGKDIKDLKDNNEIANVVEEQLSPYKRHLGELFQDKKIFGKQASDYFKNNTISWPSKQTTVGLYGALSEWIEEIHGQAAKSALLDWVGDTMELSKKYNAYASLEKDIEGKIKKILVNEGKLSMGDKVSTAYMVSFLSDIDDGKDFIKALGASGAMGGLQHYFKRYDSVDRHLKRIAADQLDTQFTDFTPIKKGIGKGLEVAQSKTFEKTAELSARERLQQLWE